MVQVTVMPSSGNKTLKSTVHKYILWQNVKQLKSENTILETMMKEIKK